MSIETILVVVHPGSLCGSMDFNLGFHQATNVRKLIIDEIKNHQGPLIILDGDLSDELKSYKSLNEVLQNSLNRYSNEKLYLRLNAPDPDHGKICANALLSNKVCFDTNIVITGAWFDEENQFGCVNHTYDTLLKLNFKNASVSRFAARMNSTINVSRQSKKFKHS